MNVKCIKTNELLNEAAKNCKTFSEAIKLKCYDCSGFSILEVKKCPVTTCPLYKFRNGHKPKDE